MDLAELDKINKRLFFNKGKLHNPLNLNTKWVIDNIECVVSRKQEEEIGDITFRILFKD